MSSNFCVDGRIPSGGILFKYLFGFGPLLYFMITINNLLDAIFSGVEDKSGFLDGWPNSGAEGFAAKSMVHPCPLFYCG